MSSPIQNLLNNIIKSMLSNVNSKIQGGVKSNHLDPWGQVAHGNGKLGSIDLGICSASVFANYNIQNMTGLSSFNINQLEITSTESRGNSGEELVGTLNMTASLGSNLSAQVGGGLEASCSFEHHKAKINGSATASGVTATATGSFKASINNEDKVCLNAIMLNAVSINYENVSVSLGDLGIFNEFLEPLNGMVTGLFKEQILGAISSAITPIIDEEINNVMPQCQNLL